MTRKKKSARLNEGRRRYTEDFKDEAVQMLLDGHTAPSVKDRLGLSSVNLLYRWKQEHLARSGPVATTLEARVKELESELRRRPTLHVGARRERDVLKKALAIFGRHE